MDGGIERPLEQRVDILAGEALLKALLYILDGGAWVAPEKLGGEGIVLLAPFRRADLAQALVQLGGERLVGEIVGKGHGDLVPHGGSGHECRALRHVGDTVEKLLHLLYLRRAHLVLYHRVALHDVRRAAARVGIGVVDTRLIYHMLA